ncbi:TPA: hypothetical protein N0F65_000216, partial [Lagenidium giganteum]
HARWWLPVAAVAERLGSLLASRHAEGEPDTAAARHHHFDHCIREARMRLFRSAYTNLRNTNPRKGGPRVSAVALAMRRPARRDPVSSVVSRFHALTLNQRHRAVSRVLQNNRLAAEEIDNFFNEADKDKDGLITQQEFRAFLQSRFSLRPLQVDPAATSDLRPTNEQLKLVMIASAIPFIGFGFVDNIIMLAAGDMIEDHFHETYHISMLTAAAMGNVVSDVVGLSLGGMIETVARRVGIPDPKLSKAQADMAITHWCNFFASAGGITLGCILGMFPLLFMNHKDDDEDVLKKKASKLTTTTTITVNNDLDLPQGSPQLAALQVFFQSPSSTMAQRFAQSSMKRWLGDAGTYPILVTCVFATAVCSFHCTRYLVGHPDVAWNKKDRTNNGMHRYESEYGANWQSHRRWFATLYKNQINEAKGLNN